MKLADIWDTITRSTRADWNHIPCWGAMSGPSFHDSFETTSSSRGLETGVESHGNVAIYREDVNLSIAWGIDVDDRFWRTHKTKLNYDFQKNFMNDDVTRCFADVFWAGSLVDREILVAVDSGRTLLPAPRGYLVSGESHEDTAVWGDKVTSREVAFARLVDSLEGGGGEFSSNLRRAGFAVIDEED